VVGFDPLSRRWAETGEEFDQVPPLDGTLRLDDATRNQNSQDNGRYVAHKPVAVLRPGSGRDIETMVRFCRRHGIKVATRGRAHSTHGQGLVPGLLIESESLATIHSIGAATAEVDAGATWLDVTRAAFQHGLTPPVITGYAGLSVGGTLSMGGTSTTVRAGTQVDHVRELEVVTGEGHTVRCSPSENRRLFEAVLAGIGQFGVITRATVELVPAKPMVRSYTIPCPDNATLFADLRTLLDRGEISDLWGQWFIGEAGLTHFVMAAQPFDPASPLDDTHLLRGLHAPPAAVEVADLPFLTFVERVDIFIAQLRETIGWDNLIKPWFDVWLPGRTAERYVGEVIQSLTPRDIGPGGFVLLFPEQRARFTRPNLRLPEDDGDQWVYLFDMLGSSERPGPDPTFARDMLARNNRLFARAKTLGGVRYPIGSIDFGHADWIAHYGERWPEFLRNKQEFDPDDILTPGPGIF
jgi:cytokinin dehydrogenase